MRGQAGKKSGAAAPELTGGRNGSGRSHPVWCSLAAKAVPCRAGDHCSSSNGPGVNERGRQPALSQSEEGAEAGLSQHAERKTQAAQN